MKKYLTDGSGDLVKGWEAIHQLLGNRFTEIQTEFGQSMSTQAQAVVVVVVAVDVVVGAVVAAMLQVHFQHTRHRHL
ncbi:hypothetical protein A2U01_0088766 [Trifolium medium]|uniref:Uncharacterized protein n=1 Tax=Trifolium medium TaxID=97028 RepID=A0A392U467_9FABA|nr:hypothetical protein [Trifolium medium]